MLGQPNVTVQEIADTLYKQAVAAYGAERAQALKGNLETLAKNIHQIMQFEPNEEVEPAFYLGTSG